MKLLLMQQEVCCRDLVIFPLGREREREGEREGWREEGRDGGKVRDGGTEAGREGGREGGREEGFRRTSWILLLIASMLKSWYLASSTTQSASSCVS